MPEQKESKTATYTIDDLKLSRDYRKTEECKRICDRLQRIMDNLRKDSFEKTAVEIAFLIGFLTSPDIE